MQIRRSHTRRGSGHIAGDEGRLYYGMIWRGLPIGIVAYVVLLLPPNEHVRWWAIVAATLTYGALILAILIGYRSAARRPVRRRVLIAQNVLANCAVMFGMWGVTAEYFIFVPLLFVIILYNAAFRGPLMRTIAWVNGTATYLAGALVAGEESWAAVTGTFVFAGAAAASQFTVSYVVGRVRSLAADQGLEREIAAHAASSIDRDRAFELMLQRSAELLRVNRFAVVATRDTEHRVVAAVRSGRLADVAVAELDLAGSSRIGEGEPEEYLRLCAGVGERPDPKALTAVRDLFRLVVDRARHMSGLYALAHSDGLTGLGNRRYLDATLEEFADAGTPYAVVIIDLDHFKELNDTEGHLAGDDVLVSTARLIRSVARTGDITARYGGEEFCIIMPSANVDEAAVLEARLRDEWRQAAIAVDFSAGIAASAPGDTPTAVLARADRALYEAKASGRGHAVRGI